jgi:hypothetical protein
MNFGNFMSAALEESSRAALAATEPGLRNRDMRTACALSRLRGFLPPHAASAAGLSSILHDAPALMPHAHCTTSLDRIQCHLNF